MNNADASGRTYGRRRHFCSRDGGPHGSMNGRGTKSAGPVRDLPKSFRISVPLYFAASSSFLGNIRLKRRVQMAATTTAA